MKPSTLIRNVAFVLAALGPLVASASRATWVDAGVATTETPAAQTARAGVLAYLGLWFSDDGAQGATPFGENLVLDYSHSVPELQAEVRGRTSAITQVRAVARLGREWQFHDLRLFPTPDANVYFAQYTAAGVSTFDGTYVEQNVLLCLEVDDGKVVRIVEFANPAIVLANRAFMRAR
jgi:ketosteroid isomerase-like protein